MNPFLSSSTRRPVIPAFLAAAVVLCGISLNPQPPAAFPIPEGDELALWLNEAVVTETEVRLSISFHADAQHNYVVESRKDLQPFAPCDAWRPVAFAPHNYGIVFLTNKIETPSRLYRLRRIDAPFTGLHALLLNDTGDDPYDGLTSDPTISGMVVPSQPGLELQAAFDDPEGPFVTLKPIPHRQHFELGREELDGIAGGLLNDGEHTLHLRTATADQPVNTFAVPFHLDTTPPQILLDTDPPLGGVGMGEGTTTRDTIALLARTEPGLWLELLGTPWAGQAGPDGWLRFENLPLALGANLLRLRALDLACNEGFAELTVTRVPTADCLFAEDLQGWRVDIAPPMTGRSPGTVTAANCVATLTEGDSFVVALEGAFTAPATPSALEVQFLGPTFDSSSAGAIKDAFEIAVVDDAGQPLTYVIAQGRDACFNLTEGLSAAAFAQGVVFTPSTGDSQPSTVTISLAHLFPGQPFRLVCRLVNNDDDPYSTVRLVNVLLATEPHSRILLASAGGARLLPSSGPPAATTARRQPGPTESASSAHNRGAVALASNPPSIPQTSEGDSILPEGGRLTFTTTADFEQGTLFNVTATATPDELRLRSDRTTFPLMWIANGGEDTVSKIDTRTGRELARYRTWFGPAGQPGYFNHWNDPWTGAAPSRTAVDNDGNVYVANRHFDNRPADVVRILAFGGIDRNGNGTIETSADQNANGVIESAEIIPLADVNQDGRIDPAEIRDERIAWVAQVGPVNGLGRATAVDRQGNIWVGLYNTRAFYKLSSDDGRILAGPIDVSPHTPYGAIVDGNGVLWSTSHGSSLLKLDTVSLARRIYDHRAYISRDYGISAGNGRVYVAANQGGCTFTEFDPASETFRNPAQRCHASLSVAVDAKGDIFAGGSGNGGVTKFRPNGSVIWFRGNQPGCGEVRGTVVDSDNNVWLIHRDTSNISKFRGSDGEPLGVFPVGNQPYTYTDATGLIQFTTTAPSGTWTEIVDSGRPDTAWGQVATTAVTPEGTGTRIRVRAANQRDGLETVPYHEVPSGQTLSRVLGRYLQVEVALRSDRQDATPSVRDITVLSVPLPTISIFEPADGSELDAGRSILLTGQAIANTLGGLIANSIRRITINGAPVDAFDSTGRFFTRITAAPGQNTFALTATDSSGQTASVTVTVFGTDPTDNKLDFTVLSDVSSSFAPEWGRTSFNEDTKTLFADLAIRNTGQYPVKTPLLIGITRLSDPSVRVLNSDGLTPDGIPYFDVSDGLTDGVLLTDQTPRITTVAFSNPRRTQFTFELVALGQLNRPPAFTTVPVIEAIVGKPYAYAFSATDPDGDPLTYSLASSPVGLTLNPQPNTLNWLPSAGDQGTHGIRLRTEDGHGGWAEQSYILSVVTSPPNRPPYFISTPVVEAFVNRPYVYDALAIDPDNDSLTYGVLLGPEGMTIDPTSGRIEWTPTPAALADRLHDSGSPDLPVMPGFDVEVYATLPDATELSFDEFGNLFVGRDLSGSGGGMADPAFIRVVSRQDRTVSDYGVRAIVDPDSVLVDLNGRFSGTPRTVLVSGAWQTNSQLGVITAIWPDQRVEVLIGPDRTVGNAAQMQFDRSGRLILLNDGPGLLVAVSNGNAVVLADLPGDYARVAVDEHDNICVGGADGTIHVRDRDGKLLNAEFARGLGPYPHLVCGPGGTTWGKDLYVVNAQSGQLYRVDGQGNMQVVGTGFAGLGPFGPDGALYVNDFGNDRILRISPSRSGGSPGQHEVLLIASDSRGGLARHTFVLSVLPDPSNHPPVIVSEPVTSAVVDQAYAYDVEALDSDNDPLTYSLVNSPAGMTIEVSSGLISWQPAADAVGSHALTVRVGDGRGGSDEQQFTISVTPTPILPDLVVGNVNRDGLTVDPQTLAAVGTVTATVTNQGAGTVSGPFEVLFFEDVNHNSAYDEGTDNPLGTATVRGPLAAGATAEVAAPVAATVTFPGTFIVTLVDSGNTVLEANEANNFARNTVACQFVPPVGQFNPVIEWKRTDFSTLPESKQVIATPCVTDLDRDGVPEIIVATTPHLDGSRAGHLRVVKGENGSEVFTIVDPDYQVNASSMVATGDIDVDGFPEIVTCDASEKRIIAFEHDGTFKWRSPDLEDVFYGAPFIADLEGDGLPEIVIGREVLNADGALLWRGAGGRGLAGGPLSVVADVDLDGVSEVVAGNTVYRGSGSILFQNASLPDGGNALGQFDADNYPEVVLVANGKVWLLEHSLEIKWGPVAIPAGGPGGAPTIADFDGDGFPEIGVAGSSYYIVCDSDGSLLWQATTRDLSSGVTGSSVFDFDGDGSAEAIYRDELHLRIYSGVDGAVRFQIPMSSCTWTEYPAIVDVDADGDAEIVTGANQVCGYGPENGIYVIGDASDTWRPTRQIWNQHAYHINNVNDDGTIPTHEEPSWLTHNTYRLNAQPAGLSLHSAPDLMACYVRLTEASGQTTITARIGNGGEVVVGPGVKVSFYNGDPESGGVRLGVASTTGRIEPGAFEDVSRTLNGLPPADLWVVADDDGTGKGQVNECNEDNNAHQLADANAKGLLAGTVFNDLDANGNWSPGGSIYLDSVEVSPTGARTTDIVRTWLDGSCPETIVEDSTPTHPSSASVAFDVNEMLMFSGEGGWLFRGNLDGTKRVNLARADGPEIEVDPIHRKVYWGNAWSGSGLPRGVYWANYDGSAAARILESPYAVTGIAVDPVRGKIYFEKNDRIIRANLDGSGAEAFYVEPGPVSPQIYDVEIDVEAGIVYWNEYWGANLSKQRFQAKKVEDGGAAWTVFHPPNGLGNGFHFNGVDQHIYYFDIVNDVCRVRADGMGYEWLFRKSGGSYYLEVLYPEGTTASDGLLAGWRVWLDLDRDQQWDAGERFLLTDGCGRYNFTHLASGEYTVVAESRAGWRHRTPASRVVRLEVGAGVDTATADFGLAQEAPPPNRPPFFTSTPPTTATVGELWRYQAVATDPDGDEVRFAFTPSGSATGMKSGDQPGLALWIPRSDQVGVNQFIAIVQDVRGASTLQPFEVTVLPPNRAPVITSHPKGPAYVGLAWQYQAAAQDPEHDVITFRLAEHPAGMTVDPGTGLVSWTPQAAQKPGQHVTVAAADGRGAEATQSFDLPVVDPVQNRPPTITSTPATTVRLGSTFLYQIEATDPDNEPVTFSLVVVPAGMGFAAEQPANPNHRWITWTPAAGQVGPHTVDVQVRDNRGLTAGQRFTLTVTLQAGNRSPSIVSQPPQAATAGALYRYDAVASEPDGDLLLWSLETFPAGMSLDAQAGTIRWMPTVDQLGLQDVRLRVADGHGGSSAQTYQVLVRAVNLPPSITSAPLTTAATDQLYTYAVQGSDPDGDALTFSLSTKPDGMTVDAGSGFIQWTPTAAQVGLVAVVIRVEDGRGGAGEQSYEIVVSTEARNQPPVITSDPALLAALNAPYNYAVTANDPDGDPLTFLLLAFPTGMTINPASGLVQWAPTSAQLGTHTVTVAAVDPDGAGGTQTFTVRVTPLNQGPTITSVPVQQVPAGTAYRYDVRASDPDGDALTYALTGPAGMTIDQFGRVAWSPQVADARVHRIVITVTDPLGEFVRQEYDLLVTADTTPPFIRLGRGADRLPQGAILEITAVASDNSGQVRLALTVGGVPVPLDARGYAEVLLNAVGTFEVLAVATDPAGNVARDSYNLTVFEVVADPDFPVVEITAPEADAVITAPVPIVGTASDANLTFYTLEVGLTAGGPLTEIGRGTASVVNGVLGRLDPTTLANDSYRLVLTAQDAGGNMVSTETSFEVAGELKIGNFTLSFVDLSIPVTGIPITVGRTYDSLHAGQRGEFGYGWRLEFREANLRNNLPPRQEYEVEYGIYPAFTERTRVYVTVPGGRRQGFTFQPARISGFGGMFGFYKPAFAPDAGVTSQLTVPAGPNVVLRYDNDSGTYQAVDSNGGTTAYNPEDPVFGGVYTLTTKEGVAYRIDAATRLVAQVFDATGNTLTFTDAAVISSAGPRVDFTRDPQGRITAVKDPAGNSIRYEYDSRGDLVAVIDREGNRTQFKYGNPRPHYLTEIIDPLGRSGVRTEYDEQGRLVKLRDAAGNPVELIHDLDNSMEQVVDALGNTNTFVYDARGNVVQEVNSLGGVTRRDYDLNNNMTLEVDALGNTNRFTYDADGNVLTRTDPLGNVTLNTYSRIYPRGWFNFTGRTITLLATTTDPLGNTTQNTYDTAGNLTATTDALGNVTRYEYDGAGNQTKITDVAGNVTQFAYDGAGRLTQQTDALGNVTTFSYDANGNQLTQATTLTTPSGPKLLVTTTTYDANGRPTSVTDAAGNITRTEYDALGKTRATIDGLGHRTEFRYDERGQLVRTVFSDETLSELAYDAAGRRTASTDRAGRTTHYLHDALGRLVATAYPDGTPDDLADNPRTMTYYDLTGRVIAQTDEAGHSTWFGYDAAGRQTSITNALGHVTRSEYDTAGRKIADLDALGRRARFEYDALGRRVKTIFADNTTKQTAYDALGRVTSETDQAGVKTEFEYDALGRLTAVVDALGGRTEYGYNEQGQLVRQQDANGHVTRYEYETCCQRSATVLPLGQRSTTLYNEVNNVKSVTDFNGRTILFEYDVNNRLKAKRFPDGTSVEFGYTPTGRRQRITDLRGLTAFEYDVRDRLLKRTDPDGRYVAYTYDVAGNRTSVITASGTTVYGFDELNRLATITDPDGGLTRYTYDEANNVRRMELPNGTVRVNTWDALNRVSNIEHSGPGGIFASFRYTMGPTGNRTEVREHDGRVVSYTYDALYRLVREAITDPTAGNRTISYTMDPVGNRLTRDDSAEGVTTYAYNPNDQLLTEALAGITTSYSYDANGNTLSRANANESAEYEWDAENHLVGARLRSPLSAQPTTLNLQYDADGIRVSKSVTEAGNSETTTYLIDANRPYAQVLEEWQSLNAQPSTLNAAYTYGPHHPISQLRNGVRSYYHADHLGSTRILSGRNGGPTDRYAFDAYGRPVAQAGGTKNVYLFDGEHRDQELGFYYLRARYFASSLGIFSSPDPVPQGRFSAARSSFLFAGGNPVDNVDPGGTAGILVEQVAVTAILPTLAAIAAWRLQTDFPVAKAGQAAFQAQLSIMWVSLKVGGELIWRDLSSFATRSGTTSASTSQTSAPPGDCTPEEHRALQDDVDAAKTDLPGKCNPWPIDNCYTLNVKTAAYLSLAIARSRINVRCFGGGNRTHQEQLASAWEIVGDCIVQCRAGGCYGYSQPEW